jgi:protein O-GlcNAc transferase
VRVSLIDCVPAQVCPVSQLTHDMNCLHSYPRQTTLWIWVRILQQVPNAILWLLRFPRAAEEHLRRSARLWGGADVEARLRFTDVVSKDEHLRRCAVPDLFLDTAGVCRLPIAYAWNAYTCGSVRHTPSARSMRSQVERDPANACHSALWAGTPLVTWPRFRYKMCSAVGASLARATGFGELMVVFDEAGYIQRAVALAHSMQHGPGPAGAAMPGSKDMTEDPAAVPGTLRGLRRSLVMNRARMPLFDTGRWTRNVERAYAEAWRRWVAGTEFEGSDEWQALQPDADERRSGCIYISDDAGYEHIT